LRADHDERGSAAPQRAEDSAEREGVQHDPEKAERDRGRAIPSSSASAPDFTPSTLGGALDGVGEVAEEVRMDAAGSFPTTQNRDRRPCRDPVEE